MNQHLKTIFDFIQQNENLTADEKDTFSKAIKDVDKELAITTFKLDRTEKVKRTTAILLEETIEELEQKRKAVEAQNRELEIEAALERVRSRSMAMQNSDELKEVVKEVFVNMKELGFFQNNSVMIVLPKNGFKDTLHWTFNENFETTEYFIPAFNHQVSTGAYNTWKNGNKIFEINLDKVEKDKFLDLIFTETDYAKVPVEFKKYLYSTEAYSQILVFEEHCGLLVDTFSPVTYTASQKDVIIRFARAFEQAYTRFLDLKKAEAQTREAEIELALERIRARTMAMQKSEELREVIAVVFEQLTTLGFTARACAIIIYDEQKFDAHYWFAGFEKGSYPRAYVNPSNKHHYFQKQIKAWKNREIYKEFIFEGEIKKQYDDFLFEKTDWVNLPDSAKKEMRSLKYAVMHDAFIKHGIIETIDLKPISDEKASILRRVAKVFEQTYTRFLDLQKAEAQAREAQIEAALERVRAKALAMHSSKDISVATVRIFNELKRLGINMIRAGIAIFNETHIGEVWSTRLSPDDNQVIDIVTGNLDFDIHPMLQNWYRAWKDKQDYYTYKLVGDDIRNYYELLGKQPGYKFPKTNKYPDRQIANSFFLNEVNIFAYTSEPLSAEEKQILHRFTKVFSLTYRRYKDLIIAEAQAREAIKQASLDRVRGEIASMRTSEDLNRITPVIWRELQALEVPFIRCGVFIVDEKNKIVHVYLTTPDGKPLGVLNLLFDANEVTANTVDFWRKKEVYKEYWNKEDFINWTKSMMKLGQVSNPETYQGAAHPPESLHLHFLPFKQGMLYVGNTSPLEKEVLELVKSLAESFSIAYARYEDFRQLEEAKNQIEKTFTDLKAAQVQLIQAEKMASLGELTAGIAHEIQNPLNFVNNFSELSNELMEEMKEELAEGSKQYAAGSRQSGEERLKLAEEIANDIKQNLEKINHHGKRAADIVKGMLQHSRTSSGVKEPTDINALADEYLRLAYHGLRAKDKSFNAKLNTDFDETIDKIDVIPQDIGRVILNLITNAFYVVDVKNKLLNDGFEPVVSVSTKKMDNQIIISVKDNGNGIPKQILDKIFQPFFTTKPTGQGTGLGLSLSYDVVKAHGGELKVETKVGEGSEFIIQLPIRI